MVMNGGMADSEVESKGVADANKVGDHLFGAESLKNHVGAAVVQVIHCCCRGLSYSALHLELELYVLAVCITLYLLRIYFSCFLFPHSSEANLLEKT